MLAVPSVAISVSCAHRPRPRKRRSRQPKAKLDDAQPCSSISWSSSTTRRRSGCRRPKRSSWTPDRRSKRPTPSPPAPTPSCPNGPSPPTRAWDRSSTSCSAPDSFTEFSDRLQFMGALAQDDADLATEAQIAGQKSRWAAQQYGDALHGTAGDPRRDTPATRGRSRALSPEQTALLLAAEHQLQERPRSAGGGGSSCGGAILVGRLVLRIQRRRRPGVRSAAERVRHPDRHRGRRSP